MKKKYKLILVIMWMIFIFVMSSFDGDESAIQSNFIVDFISKIFNINNIQILSLVVRKLAHFTEYLILGILISNWLNNYYKKLSLDVIICLIYAISDEIHQIFVPGRSFFIGDILIDTLGGIIGIIIFNKIWERSYELRKIN